MLTCTCVAIWQSQSGVGSIDCDSDPNTVYKIQYVPYIMSPSVAVISGSLNFLIRTTACNHQNGCSPGMIVPLPLDLLSYDGTSEQWCTSWQCPDTQWKNCTLTKYNLPSLSFVCPVLPSSPALQPHSAWQVCRKLVVADNYVSCSPCVLFWYTSVSSVSVMSASACDVLKTKYKEYKKT